jgi:hypothetical protein
MATATQDPRALVRKAIEIGAALHQGAQVTRTSVYLAPRLIDGDNAAEYRPWG